MYCLSSVFGKFFDVRILMVCFRLSFYANMNVKRCPKHENARHSKNSVNKRHTSPKIFLSMFSIICLKILWCTIFP